jgi:hypothetical protein
LGLTLKIPLAPWGGDSDKKRHSLASAPFRTLSLAIPPAFLDSALVLHVFGAVSPALEASKALPPPLCIVLEDGSEVFS